MRRLIGLLFLLPSLALAQGLPTPWPGQCPSDAPGSALGCFPEAANPLGTDLLFSWQSAQTPETRALQVQQLFSGSFPFISLNVTGNATVGGTLNVAGAVTFPNGLTIDPAGLAVTGSSEFFGPLAVDGTFHALGATTLSSTLDVTGAVTMPGGLTITPAGLAVTGSSAFFGPLTVGGTLGVTGATTLSSLSVTGNAAVTGTTTLHGTTITSGGLTIGAGGASVAGASNFSGAVTVLKATAASAQPLRADQSWQEIATYSASAASSVVIPLPSSFREFRLTQQKVWTAQDAKIVGIQFSFDGGGTFQNATYAWAASATTIGGVSGGTGNAADSILPVTPGLTNTDQNGWGATTTIFPGGGPNTTSVATTGFGRVSPGPTYMFWTGGGTWAGATGLANVMQLTRADGGNFSGTFILEGLP